MDAVCYGYYQLGKHLQVNKQKSIISSVTKANDSGTYGTFTNDSDSDIKEQKTETTQPHTNIVKETSFDKVI